MFFFFFFSVVFRVNKKFCSLRPPEAKKKVWLLFFFSFFFCVVHENAHIFGDYLITLCILCNRPFASTNQYITDGYLDFDTLIIKNKHFTLP